MPLNDRWKSRVKQFITAPTAAAVTGNLASDADASLHIWDVGETAYYNNTVTLTATFQPNFQLTFRGTSWMFIADFRPDLGRKYRDSLPTARPTIYFSSETRMIS